MVGLFEGLTYKSLSTNDLRSLEYVFDWIGGYCPLEIFMARFGKLSAKKGGLRTQSSYKIAPSDQISLANE